MRLKLSQIRKRVDGTHPRVLCTFMNDSGAEIKVTVFTKGTPFFFAEGEFFDVMKMKEGKDKYIGTYSTNIENLLPIEGAVDLDREVKTAPKPTVVSEDVWKDKDRRMARMNSLAHAVEIVKQYYIHCPEAEAINLKPSTITGLVIMEAEVLSEWIFKK